MDQIAPPPITSWQPELDELAERLRISRRIGGAWRVARRHAGGRRTVRERIDQGELPLGRDDEAIPGRPGLTREQIDPPDQGRCVRHGSEATAHTE